MATPEPVPYATSPDGALQICGDGPELLVYHASGQPHWKVFGEGIVTGVGASADAVVSGDAEGRVVWYRAVDGRKREEVSVGAGIVSLSVASDGRVAVAAGGHASLIPRGGQPFGLSVPDASAVALRPDGGALAVGTGGGALQVLDTATGGALGGLQLGARVSGISWSPRGFWVVTAGACWFVVSGDGTTLVARLDADGPLSSPTVSADGVLGAAVLGDNAVAVFELFHHRRVGQLEFRRRVGGAAFGAAGSLGVGLDDGDANRVDLVMGGAVRTEPHPGRGRNNWNFDAKIDHAAVRGAMALHKAGGTPIATYTGWKPDEGGSWWWSCLATAGGCGTVIFGLAAVVLVVYILHQMGYRLY